MATYPTRMRRWTRVEYERLVDLGVFHEDERLELLGGHLMVREPQGSRHGVAIELADSALGVALGSGWRVRIQLPIALDEDSEPEPDLTVVAGDPRESRDHHPSRPALVVEVAESSLRFDRETKGPLYARAGLAEYWIVNLADRVIEVYRDPTAVPGTTGGWRYATVLVLDAAGVAAPLAAPAARIAVADLLP
ncbi:MAG: Uma2 family endonuclease [Candidatus Rokuibacteriota bacterium]